MIPPAIGSLAHAIVPVTTVRGRAKRDHSCVSQSGTQIRALTDVSLAEALAGRAITDEANEAAAAPVWVRSGVFGTLEWV